MSIVKEYQFDSVQAFYKEFKAAKKEDHDFEAALADWEKTYGSKEAEPVSIRERLRQKEQVIKIREANRVHQPKQKDRGKVDFSATVLIMKQQDHDCVYYILKRTE